MRKWKDNVWFGCCGLIPWQEKHRFVQIGKIWRCCRCHARQRTNTVDGLCPVPTLGDRRSDAWIVVNYVIRDRWHKRWVLDQGREKSEEEGEIELTGLRRWKKHNLIEGSGKVSCLDCGKFSSAKKSTLGVHSARWVHLPCGGKRKVPKVLQLLLDAGTFDATSSRRG